MLRGNMLLRGALVCLLSIGLPACTPKAIAEDITGSWVEYEDTASTPSSGACGSFEFYADGSFEAGDIQERYFLNPDGTSRVSGSGKWEFDTSSKDPFAWDVVELEFDAIPGTVYEGAFVTQLYVSSDGDRLILFTWSGDESIHNGFVKTDEPECE